MKSNILQTLLLMATIFLGMQLLQNNRQPIKESAPELLAMMRESNAKLLNNTIVNQFGQYKTKVGEDKALTAEQKQQLEIAAAVLVADTQFKSGVEWKDVGRIRTAHHTLEGYQRQLLDQKVWTTPVAVTDVSNDPRFGWKEWSGQDLYKRLVSEISERNKTDLIWGFIPGGYQLIDSLVNLTGANPGFSYAFAAFLLALTVRAIVFPLAQKQLMFGRQMSQLSPLVKELQDRYKVNPKDPVKQQQQMQQELQMKTMELYKEYGINPLAGCFPLLLQMPLFLGVYQCMLHYQFEFEKGTFLWINPELSARTNGFLAPNLGRLDYILIVLYGISMIASTLLMPVSTSDPAQIKQQRLMGIGMSVVFTVMMFFGIFPVPAGFVLYWTFTNVISTGQSLYAYRQPLEPLRKVNAPGGGVFPFEPKTDANGKPTKEISNGQTKTGKPATHKPKKRK
ncbi:MAG: membrane protein insertase YidC [Fimbriimonas sp.]